MFIRINLDEENFNIFKATKEIYRHIKTLIKKSSIDKISKRLLELEFKASCKELSRKYCYRYKTWFKTLKKQDLLF